MLASCIRQRLGRGLPYNGIGSVGIMQLAGTGKGFAIQWYRKCWHHAAGRDWEGVYHKMIVSKTIQSSVRQISVLSCN